MNPVIKKYLAGKKKKELKVLIKLYQYAPIEELKGKTIKELKQIINDGMLRENNDFSDGESESESEELEGCGFLDLFRKPKLQYNNESTKTINLYDNMPIRTIQLMRTPIMGVISKFINVISLGAFEKLKKKYKYDDMFHLAMICNIGDNNIVVEKNEVVNISKNYKSTSKTEILNIKLNKPITIKQLFDNTLNKVGKERFFKYSGLEFNCQRFILDILESNNLSNPTIKNWVYQDVSSFKKEMPKFVEPAMNAITDLGARTNAMIGKGSNGYYEFNQKCGCC